MIKNISLEPKDITPLYIQLKTIIRNKINTGEYAVNCKIPSEKDLSTQYNISRVTVRKAIEELSLEGYLTSKKGKGSFVNLKNEFDKIEYFTGFTKSMENNGMQASSIVLKKRIIPADFELAQKLNMKEGEDVLFTQRILLANKKPVILEGNYFSLKQYGFLVNEDLTGSLYGILDKRGIQAIHPGTTTLELYLSDNEMSTIMNVPFNTPFFFINSIINDQFNKPIHVGKQYYLAEVYRFNI